MMPRNQFRPIIIDESSKTFEVLALSANDTNLINLIIRMQDHEMDDRCQTIEAQKLPEEIQNEFAAMGYGGRSGLYERLKSELEKRLQNKLPDRFAE